jgi:hypothetical protein
MLAAGLTILLGLTLDIAGALHVYGLASWMGQRLALATGMLLGGIAAGWLLLALVLPHTDTPPDAPSATLPGGARLLPLLLLLAWLASARSYLVFLAPRVALPDALFLALVALLLLLALLRGDSSWRLLLIALPAGCLLRLASFAHVPIDPAQGDMLPLVRGALGNLLAGHSPYTLYAMPWQLPLTYPPLTWLAYLPVYASGLDIRLTNLLAELGTGAALAWRAWQQDKTSSAAQVATSPALLLWAWLFLQPSLLSWSLATTAPVWWLLLSILLVLVLARRPWLAACALGLCAAASSLAAIVAPLLLLHWLRVYAWQRVLLLCGLAGVVAACLVLPFWLWSPQQFVLGVIQWFNDNDLYPRMRWEMDHTWARQTGFSGVFWRHQFEWLLKPIQAALLVGLAVLYWREGAGARQLPALLAAAFLLFMLFNPVLWPYLYNPALVAALAAVAASTRWTGK